MVPFKVAVTDCVLASSKQINSSQYHVTLEWLFVPAEFQECKGGPVEN